MLSQEQEKAVIRLAATVSAGDTLVLSFDHRISAQQADEIQEYLRAKIPNAAFVIVDDIENMVVIKAPEADHG